MLQDRYKKITSVSDYGTKSNISKAKHLLFKSRHKDDDQKSKKEIALTNCAAIFEVIHNKYNGGLVSMYHGYSYYSCGHIEWEPGTEKKVAGSVPSEYTIHPNGRVTNDRMGVGFPK